MGHLISLTASDTHHFSAYEAGDASAARALVIVQEVFGLTDHIRTVCDELADRHGYHVIAPSLFDRARRDAVLPYDQNGITEGLALRAAISPDDILADVTACAHALGEQGHGKIGILGFCWGGLVAWEAATRSRAFSASCAWYGGGIAGVSHEKPHCPVQLHFGGEDDHIPHTDINTIRENRPEVEIFVYDGAGHGFGCADRPSFDRNARDLAHERTVAFFETHL